MSTTADEGNELEALSQLARGLATVGGFEAQMNLVSAALPSIAPFAWGRLFVRRDEEATLDERVTFLSIGEWREADPDMRERVRIGEGVIGAAAAAGEATVLPISDEGDPGAPRRSRLLLPAVFRGKVLAVLEVVATRLHSTADLRRLECVTAHLASAMMNDELIARERRARGRRRPTEKDERYDRLTGVLNYPHFEIEFAQFLERSQLEQIPAALLRLDIDHFTKVNETGGREAGDELLRHIARRIEAQLRSLDRVARSGPDDFTILIVGTGAEEAESVASRLLNTVKGHMLNLENRPVHVTVSIGASLLPQHGSTLEELRTNAEVALDRAREEGGDRCLIFAATELGAASGG